MPVSRQATSDTDHQLRWDVAFLSVVLLASCAFYLGRLGFYSDDWANIAEANFQGWSAPFAESFAGRQLHGLYLFVLNRLFGLNPLGYHLTNAAVIVAVGILLYTVLRRLRLPRHICVAIALIYGLLPHYSVTRFWYAAFPANLSIALGLAAYYFALRGLSALKGRVWLLFGLSVACLMGSALAYEVALPLLAALPVVMWIDSKRSHVGPLGSRTRTRLGLFAAATAVVLAVLIPLKTSTARYALKTDVFTHVLDLGRQAISLGSYPGYGLNFRQAVTVDFWIFGVKLPLTTRTLWSGNPLVLPLVLGGAVGIATYLYLMRLQKESNEQPSRRSLYYLAVWGLAAFLGGYAIFLTNDLIQIVTTGIGNRVKVAAAIGVSILAVAAIGLISSLVPRSVKAHLFAALIAVTVCAGLIVNNVLASYWIDAYREEQRVLDRLAAEFPSLPSDATVLLDGVCSWVGPAVVFESAWDLQGALRLRHGSSKLRADVLRHARSFDRSGVTVPIYSDEYSYPYGHNVFVHNYARDETVRLSNFTAARRYFEGIGRSSGDKCPDGEEGSGLRVL